MRPAFSLAGHAPDAPCPESLVSLILSVREGRGGPFVLLRPVGLELLGPSGVVRRSMLRSVLRKEAQASKGRSGQQGGPGPFCVVVPRGPGDAGLRVGVLGAPGLRGVRLQPDLLPPATQHRPRGQS